MTTTSGVIGKSAAFGAEFGIRVVAGRHEVVRRANRKGARWGVMSRHDTEEAAQAAYKSLISLASYWAGSASEAYAQRVEAGNVRTITIQTRAA